MTTLDSTGRTLKESDNALWDDGDRRRWGVVRTINADGTIVFVSDFPTDGTYTIPANVVRRLPMVWLAKMPGDPGTRPVDLARLKA